MMIIKKMLLYEMLLILAVGIFFVFENKVKETQGFTIAVVAITPLKIKPVSLIIIKPGFTKSFNDLVWEGFICAAFVDTMAFV